MPVISRFYGITIAMYFREHPPPHFHVKYGEYRASVEIVTGTVEGKLPRRALALVDDWRQAHVQELLACWELARREELLPAIAPLE